MRPIARGVLCGLLVIGGGLALRRVITKSRGDRRRAGALGRRLRYRSGQLRGASYRLHGGHPDETVSGETLADRVRSSLGPLEKRLDLPRIHVMAEDHVVLLHGEVSSLAEAEEIERATATISGVRGVESYLHVGLVRGDIRPSAGRAVFQPSPARRRLLRVATEGGVDPGLAPAVVRAVLATFAERIPPDERRQVAAHLPADVKSMFLPPRRIKGWAPYRTTAELVARVSAVSRALPPGHEVELTAALLQELRALVRDEADDVSAVLPPELRRLWQPAGARDEG